MRDEIFQCLNLFVTTVLRDKGNGTPKSGENRPKKIYLF